MLDLPYPGLRPFQPDKTHAYFGRETQTDDLLDRLGDTRFLAVIGPSGCGKSSLVNTGLIASLELGLLASTGERWSVARMQPQNKPMHNLSTALIENGVVELPDKGEDPNADEGYRLWIENTLKRGPLGLKDVLDRHPLPERTNLLVVVDQFEEVFRYRDSINQQEADAFIALLLRSASLSEVPIYVVITMRSDFLGQCTVFPGLPEAINKGQFLTPRLTREEVKEAIEGPAEVYGGGVDPALTSRLLNAIGSSDDQLPVLQHALQRMWTRALEQAQSTTILEIDDDESSPVQLSLDTYRLVGGIDNALSNHADEAFNELDDDGQTIAAYLFVALTERTNRNVDIRRPVSVEEVAKIANVPVADVVAVADRFRRPDRSFIVPSQSDLPVLNGETLLDISHESLIRQWKRMVGWVEEEVEAASNYIRLEDSACLWRDKLTDFLSDIELDRLLQWRDERVPNKAWAKRYGTSFELAMEYLELSRANRDSNRTEKEKQRKERRRSRMQQERQKWQIGGLVIVLLAVAGWWQSEVNENTALDFALAYKSQTASADAYSQKQYTKSQLMRLTATKTLGAYSINVTSLLLDGLINNNMINKIVQGSEGRINAVAINRRGDLVAQAGRTRRGQAGGVVVIRNIDNWESTYRLTKHKDGVSSISFSEDDRFLASGGYDGNIFTWNMNDGTLIDELDAQRSVLNIIYGQLPKGDDFVISSGEKEKKQPDKAYFWYMQDGHHVGKRKSLSNLEKVLGVVYAEKTGLAVLFSIKSGSIRGQRWDIAADKGVGDDFEIQSCLKKGIKQSYTECAANYQQFAVSNDGNYLATLTDSRQIMLWNLAPEDSAEPKKIALLKGHDAKVLALRFHGSQLASSSRDGEIFLWDTSLDAIKKSELRDRRILELPILQPKTKLPDQNDWVRSLSFSADGKELISSSGNNFVLWSIGDRRLLTTVMRDHKDEVWSLALNGSHLVTGGKDSTLRLWKDRDEYLPSSSVSPIQVESHTTSLAINALTGLLAIADYSGRLQVRELVPSGKAQPVSMHLDRNLGWNISGVAFSQNGRFLAISGFGGELLVKEQGMDGWRNTLINPKQLEKDGRKWRVTGWGDNLTFSDDGKQLFFGTEKRIEDRGELNQYKIRWVNLPSPNEDSYDPKYVELKGKVNKIYTLAYSKKCGSDKTPCLVAGGTGNDVQIWHIGDRGKWEIKKKLKGHQNRINTVSISPDGKTIASGSRDHTVRLWDLDSEQEIAVLDGHSSYVTKIAFGSDGKWLYSASDDTTIIRTNVNFDEYPDLVCNTIDRNLTCDEWDELNTKDTDYLQLCPNSNFKIESCE